MRSLITLIAVIALATLAAAIYFRLVPMQAAAWHVDPATAEPPNSPNFALRQGEDAAEVDGPRAIVAARLDAAARAEGATRIAGDLTGAAGHATYVVRSRLMGYPDAVSIRLTDAAGGTRIEIFSRSRFGYSDMGVNAARVARWIDAATTASGA